MITEDGHFFHIDFGFILGQDPKPLPPAIRLTYEMIDGMGGLNSTEYVQFKIFCCKAFNILRKYANYILVMLNTMTLANIPHLSGEYRQNLYRVVEKNFHLELNDQEADEFILGVINSSLSSLMPQITEKFHELAQSLKT